MKIEKNLTSIQYTVDLVDIDDSPGPFCMSFGFELEPLIRSIQNVGMVNPPLLIQKKPGTYTIIAGYRRIRALKSLDIKKTSCGILSESRVSELECFRLNLHDNLANRVFNEVEKGMVLSRLTSLVSQDQILSRYMPLLGLPSHSEKLFFYLKLEKELEKEMKIHLARGRMSLQVARMLFEIGEGDRIRVFELISSLNLNINYQKQLIDYIVDISHIKQISVSTFLTEKIFSDIPQKEGLNKPQKVNALFHSLRVLRFPTLVHAEENFSKNVTSLGLTKGVKVSAPPYFESPHFRLEILFKNGKELKERLRELTKKEGLEVLGNPWEERV